METHGAARTVRLTDARIEELIREQKALPPDHEDQFQASNHQGHERRMFTVTGAKGTVFRVFARRSLGDESDFSIVLACSLPDGGPLFRLRRYNGSSHEHTNDLEGEYFEYQCHVHYATERYPLAGYQEEKYAQTTDRHHDWDSAFRCMLDDCGFVRSDDTGPSLDLDGSLIQGASVLESNRETGKEQEQ